MTTADQKYARFVNIIVNAFEMKCIEILVENNCYDNCEEMIDTLTETISKDQKYWKIYTKLITDDIKQIIIDVCIESPRFDEECYINKFKLLKAFISRLTITTFAPPRGGLIL